MIDPTTRYIAVTPCGGDYVAAELMIDTKSAPLTG